MEAGLLPDSDSQKKAQTRGFFNLDTKVYPKHESKQLLKTNVSIDMQKECIHFG